MSSSSHPSTGLQARGLCWHSPDGRPVLEGIDLELSSGRIGIVGPNGSGKTTLLRLLVGELQPTRGRVDATGHLAWLPQHARLDPEQGLARALGVHEVLDALRRLEEGEYSEALMATVGDRWDLEARVEAQLDRMGLGHLDLDRRVGTLSGGEEARCRLAARLLEEPDVLALDEPTNHLDATSRARLTEALLAFSAVLVVVSHDRALLEHMETTVALSGGGARVYGAGYSGYREMAEAERQAAERRRDHARTTHSRARSEARELAERQAKRSARGRRNRRDGSQPKMVLNKWKAQSERTSSRLAEQRAGRVADTSEALREAEAAVESRAAVRLDLTGTRVPTGRVVFRAEGLAWGSPDGSFRLGPLHLEVQGPQRIALQGDNGSGKSSLLRLLTGEEEPSAGVLERAPLRLGVLDQTAAFLDRGESVLANLQRLRPELEHAEARWWLDRFAFSRHVVDKRVGVLSGGERVRTALCCLLAGSAPPQLLVLDEPGNNLDLETQAALVEALESYEGVLLVVSHDAALLEDLRPTVRWRLGVREVEGRRVSELE